MIKVAEVYRFEDVTSVAQPVYNGNIVLIDYSPIENDQQTLKKITNELKNIARELVAHVRKVSQRNTCVSNMWMLWDCARSYSMARSIPVDRLVDPKISASDYVRGNVVPICPAGTQPYGPFRLLDGPTCPNGHELPPKGRRELRRFWSLWNGAKDREDLVDALRDQSGLVRMGGIQAVTPGMADDAVVRELRRIAVTDTKYYYACGPYYQQPANVAAADVLKKLRKKEDSPVTP